MFLLISNSLTSCYDLFILILIPFLYLMHFVHQSYRHCWAVHGNCCITKP